MRKYRVPKACYPRVAFIYFSCHSCEIVRQVCQVLKQNVAVGQKDQSRAALHCCVRYRLSYNSAQNKCSCLVNPICNLTMGLEVVIGARLWLLDDHCAMTCRSTLQVRIACSAKAFISHLPLLNPTMHDDITSTAKHQTQLSC
jgi:hypothetical protein